MQQYDNGTPTRAIEYNSERPQLKLPEYGRNIQSMVDHCLSIEDRTERTRCAHTIIKIMGDIVPQLRDDIQSRHILWDHLAIMSGFQLDVDCPYDMITADPLATKPQPVLYSSGDPKHRQYGRIIESMIARAADYEDGEEKDELITMLANQMKKTLVAANKDSASDERVLNDLRELSNGKIDISPDKLLLHDYVESPAIIAAKKGSKKKK